MSNGCGVVGSCFIMGLEADCSAWLGRGGGGGGGGCTRGLGGFAGGFTGALPFAFALTLVLPVISALLLVPALALKSRMNWLPDWLPDWSLIIGFGLGGTGGLTKPWLFTAGGLAGNGSCLISAGSGARHISNPGVPTPANVCSCTGVDS